jgi:hypothetical protein
MQQECFEALKLALSTAPTLKLPDFDMPFEVIVDASNIAIGAVLLQDKKPVAYESKKLSPTEMRWTTTEREVVCSSACTETMEMLLATSHSPIHTMD